MICHRQQGFLLMAMVIVMVLVTILAMIVVRIVFAHNQDSLNQQHGREAFYIAEGGLQRARYEIANGLSCASVNNDRDLSKVPLANGQFTVTASQYYPAKTRLTRAVNSQSSAVSVASISGYAPSGWLTIDDELVYYRSISFSIIDCQGRAPCFTSLLRGVGGSNVVSHPRNSQVEQQQCNLTAVAAVPNFTAPQALQRVIQHVNQISDIDIANSWQTP